MSVLIITEDTATKLPQVDKWTTPIRKGQDIEKNIELVQLLKTHNSTIPSDDLKKEKAYKTILKKYIRPAKYMFSAVFSEVRDFSDESAELTRTDLYIISGRYGLINGNDEIIPYSKTVKTSIELAELDRKTDFVKNIQTLLNQYSIIIFLLPSEFIKFFLIVGFFDSIPKKQTVIIVTSTQNNTILGKYPNFITLSRKGLARLGAINREKIIDLIKKKNTS
ncbi:hypothetical protein [Methanoregula sp.]|jgi:cytoplasmic iron level regulating protein YaaA (DUF328/UPF0246 family)|uniref:hypothetical protein n=1 Tax=Methanoregula sp. TaxID=2052170 RepID=UPI00262ACB49|nr:hypothetical protein [Methanoregula sp.]MDD5142874.1 hypothetical protein [Methanoregula sp.]